MKKITFEKFLGVLLYNTSETKDIYLYRRINGRYEKCLFIAKQYFLYTSTGRGDVFYIPHWWDKFLTIKY